MNQTGTRIRPGRRRLDYSSFILTSCDATPGVEGGRLLLGGAVVEAAVRIKKDKPYSVTVLKKYFKSEDDNAMGIAYDYYVGKVMPLLPFPKAEQLQDARETLLSKNPKVKDVDLNKMIDDSFVKSAGDRGLVSWTGREKEFAAAYADKAPATVANRSPIERAVIAFVYPKLLNAEKDLVAKNVFQLTYKPFDWTLNDLTGRGGR